MRIEIAIPAGESNNVKGNLLEVLGKELLEAQGYLVTKQVRLTGSEVDLHCQHKVSAETIYVECKAHKDPLSANIIKNLLGERVLHEYHAVWLVSAGPLGKDAKGVVNAWEQRDSTESRALRVYTPRRLIDAFVDAKVLRAAPHNVAEDLGVEPDQVGEVLLLVSPFGRHWVVPILVGGVPREAVVFSATTGKLVSDGELISRISSVPSSVSDLSIRRPSGPAPKSGPVIRRVGVVHVSTGESWKDYRPSRPEDFVGRIEVQREVLKLLERMRKKETPTRVLALTGDSGMGKSSLIAKLRDRVGTAYYRRRLFIFAVDARAATDASYVYSALVAALRGAALHFDLLVPQRLRVADPATPLDDPSIVTLLDHLARANQHVCLIFDQFEELYTKPSLYPVFEAIRTLMMAVIAARGPLSLGFAWKTDATVPQEHPAYHMWHQLSDHRHQVTLNPFDASEAGKAVTIFERELGESLRPELRRQLVENSQGYPWLLKKLCIHLYEQRKVSGLSQTQLADRALDVASLFERDLKGVSPPQASCLRYVARHAPVDIYELYELYDHDSVRGLQDKRLIVRTGDRVNVYWDIFQEYLKSQRVPAIPLTYLPSSPSLGTLLDIAALLNWKEPTAIADLAASTSLGVKTTGNVVRDLVMFGVAARESDGVLLDESIDRNDPEAILVAVRKVLKRHGLALLLDSIPDGVVVDKGLMVSLLKETLPTAQHRRKTWDIYAERMLIWLQACGLVHNEAGDTVNGDIGKVSYRSVGGRTRSSESFMADAPPEAVVQTLESLLQSSVAIKAVSSHPNRNAIRVLCQFRLVVGDGGLYRPIELVTPDSAVLKVWQAARENGDIARVVGWVETDPEIAPREVGRRIAQLLERDWSLSSCQRTGAALMRWARWVHGGEDDVPATFPLSIRRDRRLSDGKGRDGGGD